jgi:hypothetical protein
MTTTRFLACLWIAAATLTPAMPAAAQDKPRFKLAENGGVLVDGQPFLPIFAWAQPSSAIEMHKGLGVNTMHPGDSPEKDPLLPYLDKLQKNNMLALVGSEAMTDKLKDHPAVLAWTVEHEPDGAVSAPYTPDLGGDATIIWIEGESPKSHTFKPYPWMDPKSTSLSGGRWLPADANGEGMATYEFEAKKAGKYNLWVREFTKSWSNPTIWSLNGAAEQTTPRTLQPSAVDRGDLGGGRAVNWALYGEVELKEGKNTLTMRPAAGRTLGKPDKEPGKEAMWAIDVICFTTAASFPPAKKLDPTPTRLPEIEKANYEKVKKLNPNALTWNIMGAGFFGPYHENSKLPMKYYAEFLQWSDITNFDLYPVTGYNQPAHLPEVGLATRALVGLTRKGQPAWATIEASDQELSWTAANTKGPTGAQMRAEVWMSIAGGAKGIGYFTIAFGRGKAFKWNNLTDEIKAEMKRTNGELTELTGPIVLGDTDKKLAVSGDETKEPSAAGHAIQAIRKEYKGKTYVLAVNVTAQAAKATLKLEGVSAKKVAVWKEDRSLDAADGAFSDEFKPLAVHWYVIEQ